MSLWQLEYFEAGASKTYMRETLIGIEAKDAAVLRFLRLGGDEVLKVTLLDRDCMLRWMKRLLHLG